MGSDAPGSGAGTFPTEQVGMMACGVGLHLCPLSFLGATSSPFGAC